jgi:hypothetical protein
MDELVIDAVRVLTEGLRIAADGTATGFIEKGGSGLFDKVAAKLWPRMDPARGRAPEHVQAVLTEALADGTITREELRPLTVNQTGGQTFINHDVTAHRDIVQGSTKIVVQGGDYLGSGS